MVAVRQWGGIALVAGALVGAVPTHANPLSVYCSMPEEWCRVMVNGFVRETGMAVDMVRKSTGEAYAQIRSEASRPRADVWWGGTSDPHLQAAEEGLTQEYRSPLAGELHPWAQRIATLSNNRAIGVAAGVMGFVYNAQMLARRALAAPRCWTDLLKPEYKGEIQVSNPNTAGTGYTALATILQLWDEERGFEYLKKLNANVNQYTKSGDAPAVNAARGETLVGIAFLQAAMPLIANGFALTMVAPCEGTGYEVPAMSIIKGGPNPEGAKVWFDWALTPAAQELAVEAKADHSPANMKAKIPSNALDMTKFKLIDYDVAKFGRSEVRRRILARWEAEIGNAR